MGGGKFQIKDEKILGKYHSVSKICSSSAKSCSSSKNTPSTIANLLKSSTFAPGY